VNIGTAMEVIGYDREITPVVVAAVAVVLLYVNVFFLWL
jgi:hypothetical protein